jgi:hypothetical protein
MAMSFQEHDRVVLRDRHSEHDGDVGPIAEVTETSAGGPADPVGFEDGQESGVPLEQLEPAEENAA